MHNHPIRVLLVEDDEDDYILTDDLLSEIEGIDYDLEWVETYEAGQAAIACHEHDVYLVDYRLGARSGLELLSEAVKSGFCGPIILLTGQDDHEIDIKAMKAGAADYLFKGRIDSDLLERSIRYAMERAKTLEALRESEERYAIAVRGANDGLWDWNLKNQTAYFSPRWKEMLGCTDDEIADHPDEWFRRIHSADVESLRSKIEAHLEGDNAHFEHEYRMAHKDGSFRWMLTRGAAVHDQDGKAYRIAGSQTDVTDHKSIEDKLRHNAFHDTLTGLPNRSLFMDRLSRAIIRAKRHSDYLFAVLFLDFDRFKLVNDSLGHLVGDELLIAISEKLQRCLRAGDTVARPGASDIVARLGGDEFTILLDGFKHTTDVIAIVNRIQRALGPPFKLRDHEIFSTASIGIALSSTGYDRPEEVLRDADTAMYRAKALGRARYEIFDPSMHEQAVSLLQKENDLRHALEREEFRIYYQPIVSLETGKIASFEALLRWQHPDLGIVSPAEFLPVLEETGLIVPVGEWVLREACQQLVQWQRQSHTDSRLAVTVNLSGKQFRQPNLANQVEQILQETGLDAQNLKLEITESIVMGNTESTINTLARLKTLNVQLHVDDFGTGYSSLSWLHRFPLDMLKIDRSFVSRMTPNDDGSKIVHTIMMLAQNLGLTVTAEGIETPEQLEQLREMGCEYGQGYFFAKPLDCRGAAGLTAENPRW